MRDPLPLSFDSKCHMYCLYCSLTLKPLSDIHEFIYHMRRIRTSYNSLHIVTNNHELCHKRFGQNYSTSFIRHIHDIHGEISAGSCDPVRVYRTLVRVLRYVYENHTTFLRHVYEFLRVCKSSARSIAILYDLVQYTTIFYDIFTRLARQRTNLALTRFLHDF